MSNQQTQAKFQAQIELVSEGVPVKYGDYEGYKTEGYIHQGEKYPKSTEFHLPEKMETGVYDIVSELQVVKGKPVARLTYVKNMQATKEMQKAS